MNGDAFVLGLYGLGSIGFVILAVVLYLYAMSTRRKVICRSCGEVIRMEHDRVRTCPSCGSEL